MYSDTRFKKSALRNAVLLALSINGAALALSVGAAHADNQVCGTPISNSDSNNFTMLKAGTDNGNTMGLDGGANDVLMSWDGTAYTASSDYTGPGGATNMTLSSSDPFFGASWVAHDIQVFAPGSYSFDAGDNTPGAGTGGSAGSNNEAAGTMLNVTVPAGMLGMHMLFDWSGNNNIDVFVVASPNSVFGAGIARSTTGTVSGGNNCDNLGTANIKNCLFDGKPLGPAGKPLGSQVWMLASVDGDGDGIMGIPMPVGGPFAGFRANFNLRGTLTLTSGTVCNPTDDTQPDAFDFPDVTGATASSENTSGSITVSGLTDLDGGGVSAPISIAGGTYSINNSGTYINTAGTVTNGDTVTVRQTASANEDGTRTDTLLNIGGVVGTYSVTVVDKKPAAFSFTDQTDVATSTPVESNAITISGMDSILSTPISISGGTYTINGGAPTSTAGTVVNGDTVKVQQTSSANGATTTIATLTLGSAGNGTAVSGTFSVRTAGGLSSTGNNFTMLDKPGGVTGGTNDVVMNWDQQYNTSTSDPVTPATAHMHLSSVTPFFGYNWTAHHIRVFSPGTYTINVDCTTAQLETGTCAANADATKNYTFTVGANQIGAHMLFDWNTTTNIDVVDVWNQSAIFGPSLLYTGAGGCANTAQVWDLMSTDWDSDGQNGAKMIDGPFVGFKANFNLRTTSAALSCGAYTPTVNVSSPSGAGGCSINPTPTNLQARADWWLVAGFLAWLGGIRFRFKRRQAKS